MKRRLVISLIFVFFFLGICSLLFQISKSRTFQFFGEIHSRVETSEKVAALTFDDGPSNSRTDEILGILREKNVKVRSPDY